MFRRKCDGRHHRWSHWRCHNSYAASQDKILHRSCKCGAIQRFHPHTGDVYIWQPDGVDSGLLDRGVTRQILEGL